MPTAPPSPTTMASSFESLNPATGQLVGRFPLDGPAEVGLP